MSNPKFLFLTRSLFLFIQGRACFDTSARRQHSVDQGVAAAASERRKLAAAAAPAGKAVSVSVFYVT
jgi:hypothetical protein